MNKLGVIVIALGLIALLAGCATVGATRAGELTPAESGMSLEFYTECGIKIIGAHENPAIEGFTEPDVHLMIDIDGYELHVGGIDASWNRTVVLDYLCAHYDDLLAQAIAANEIEDDTTRWDLLDAEGLPHSQHIGKLVSVNPSLSKPATVTRKCHGMTYNIQCLVSQTVVDMWIADTLNIGDYVVVSFIDEITDTEEVNLAIVVDKVYDSWS